jgi:hypothetical protein
MELCAWTTLVAVISVNIFQQEMTTEAHVPIHADGNTLSWRKSTQDSISLCMKMKQEATSITQKIYVE